MSPSLIQHLKDTQQTCYFCGIPIKQSGKDKNKCKAQMHHLIHKEHGGDNSPANLVRLCKVCHKTYHTLFNKLVSGDEGTKRFWYAIEMNLKARRAAGV